MAKKSEAAAELARARWDKTTAAERTEHASAMGQARWDGASEEQRKAVGKMLAAARSKKRPAGKRQKKK